MAAIQVITIGILLPCWYCNMPDAEGKLELQHSFPKVYSYLMTNLLFYIMSICCWSMLICTTVVPGVGSGFLGVLFLCNMCIIVWNLCHFTEIYDKEFVTHVPLKKTVTLVHAMYWIRNIPLLFCGLACFIACFFGEYLSGDN